MDKFKLRKLDRAKKFALSGLGIGVGAVTFALSTQNPIGFSVAVPLLYTSAKGFDEAMHNEYIKNSMMNADSNNKISQKLPGIKQILAIMNLRTKEQKSDFLTLQELNFLLGSDTVDEKGNQIQYSTHSHAITYRNLSKLQKDGFIENLKREHAGKKKLILESVVLGNFDKLRDKPADMYNISFSKTDKAITDEYICRTLNITPEELKVKYDVKRDKEGKIINLNYNVRELMKENLGSIKERVKKRDLSKKDKFISELQSGVIKEPTYKDKSDKDKEVIEKDDLQI